MPRFARKNYSAYRRFALHPAAHLHAIVSEGIAEILTKMRLLVPDVQVRRDEEGEERHPCPPQATSNGRAKTEHRHTEINRIAAEPVQASAHQLRRVAGPDADAPSPAHLDLSDDHHERAQNCQYRADKNWPALRASRTGQRDICASNRE